MDKDIRREYFSIPNLMGYFRIILVPVYLYVYLTAKSDGDYYLAAGIMLLSFLSDFLDGKIARRFHMITEFGKILDPFADKLTHAAMALSFAFRYPGVKWILAVFMVKEVTLAIIGGFIMHKGHRMNGAQWHGKVCTAILDAVMLILLLVPNPASAVVKVLTLVSIMAMLYSFAAYLMMYAQMWKYDVCGKQGEKGTRIVKVMKTVLLLGILLYLILGAILPFAYQPGISPDTRDAAKKRKYYSTEYSGESACILADNETALKERIRMIEQAQEELVLATFEFRSDKSGKDVMAALLAASDRGVKVSILADGMSDLIRMENNPYFYALSEEENIEIRIYNPISLIRPWTGMGRMHDKYMISDKTSYMVGGRNTYDFFLGDYPGYKNYDWDALVYSGSDDEENSIYQLKAYFESVWELSVTKKFEIPHAMQDSEEVADAKAELRERYKELQVEKPQYFKACNYAEMMQPVRQIQLISNPIDIYAKEPVVFGNLIELMKRAEHEVVLHTPYIIANDAMLEELKSVVDEVGNVKLMTNSIANNGNHFGAMDYMKNKKKILDTGVQVLEYDAGVSYHGKCLTIDDRISVVGSYNLDMRSTYLDTELMLVIDSEEVNRELRAAMEEYESKALMVIDEEESVVLEGMTAQTLSTFEKVKLKVMQWTTGWLRFLM